VEGGSVELRCNECGAVVGVVQIDVLRGLLGLVGATAKCPHCGHENMLPGFDKMMPRMRAGGDRGGRPVAPRAALALSGPALLPLRVPAPHEELQQNCHGYEREPEHDRLPTSSLMLREPMLVLDLQPVQFLFPDALLVLS
jgi:hypothetical protein